MMSAHVLITRPSESTTDWLKLKPLRLNAIVETPRAVSQIPTTGHVARKKCSALELLNEVIKIGLRTTELKINPKKIK